ncbi:MAG: ArnT family glycosyltransferase [Kiritimatiellia bacterium]
MQKLRLVRDLFPVFLVALGAWLSAVFVLVLTVARAAHDYSGLLLQLGAGFGIAIFLAVLPPSVLARHFALRGLEASAIREKLELIHYPLYLFWLCFFDVPLPVFGSLKFLLNLVVFIAIAFTLVVAIYDPTATSIVSAFRSLKAFFRHRPTGERIAKGAPYFLIPLLCLILMPAYRKIFQNVPYDNGCEFGGDVWEYQSIAVNYARGHGFPIFGGLESFEVYSFGHDQDKRFPDLLKRFYAEATPNRPGFYRAPGYTFFLGTIYKWFGISPFTAKQFQMWLLIIVASFIPLVGWLCWRWSGFIGGIFAGWIYLSVYRNMTALLITENLLTFLAFVFVVAFLLWEKRTNILTSVLLGLVMAACFLTKGWFYPLAPFVALFGLRRVRQGRLRWMHLLLLFGTVALAILPWSVYATRSSGKLTIICTQASVDLINVNNEKVIETGKWEPQAAREPGSFYRRPDIERLPWPVQVALFHVEHAQFVPLMWLRKFRRSYTNFPFFRIAVLLVCFEVARNIINHLYRKNSALRRERMLRIVTGVLLWVVGLGMVVETFFGFGLSAWLRADVNNLLLFSIPFALSALVVRGIPQVTGLHPALWLITLNSLAITLFFYGYDRFIWPVDIYFILIALRYAVFYLSRIFVVLVQLHTTAKAAG